MFVHHSLLLVHGLIDENVHFRHSARLLEALAMHQKHYDLVILPSERHTPLAKQVTSPLSVL